MKTFLEADHYLETFYLFLEIQYNFTFGTADMHEFYQLNWSYSNKCKNMQILVNVTHYKVISLSMLEKLLYNFQILFIITQYLKINRECHGKF